MTRSSAPSASDVRSSGALVSGAPLVRSATGREALLVAAFQTDARANGGLASLTAILERLGRSPVVVLTDRESEVSQRWRQSGFEVHVWPGASPSASEPSLLRRTRGALRALAFNRRLSELMRRLDCRVLHCNDIQALVHVGPAARLSGLKVVFTIRSTQGVHGLRWRLARALSHRVVALSREMQSYLERALPPVSGLPAGQIETIYSIVDFERMRPASAEERTLIRARLGIPTGELALGIVGVFAPRKQQLEALRWLAQAPSALPAHAKLYFIGDFDPIGDEYSRACQRVLESAPLAERVRIMSYREDVAAWYQALDVLVLPSRHEGLARAMIEALACGLPVASFDVCSARELLAQHACGSVVSQGDFQGLFTAAARIGLDPSLAERMRVNGVRSARRLFAAEQAVAAWLDLYRRVEQGGA